MAKFGQSARHNFPILTIFVFALFVFGSVGLSIDYNVAVEKNLFSPERRYDPYFPEKKGTKPRKDVLERGIILRGTLLKGKKRLAVIEVSPAARRELRLEDTKQRRFTLSEGETLGDCEIVEIRPEEVLFGGRCQGLLLSLKESPERRKTFPANPVNKTFKTTSKRSKSKVKPKGKIRKRHPSRD